jgi:hypothetical protein
MPKFLSPKKLDAYIKNIATEIYNSNELILAANFKIAKNGSLRGFSALKKSNSSISLFDQKIFDRICTATAHYIKSDPRLALIENKASLISHLNSIDFRMPVEIVPIPAGTMMTQIQAKGKGLGESLQGSYYSFSEPNHEEISWDANTRGIADSTIYHGPALETKSLDSKPKKHHHTKSTHKKNNQQDTKTLLQNAKAYIQDMYIMSKQLTYFKTTRDIQALQSTAAPTIDTWSMPIALEVKGGGKQLHVGFKDNSTVVPLLRFEWHDILNVLNKDERPFTDTERNVAHEKMATYAMVIYNRANANKDMIATAIDELIFLEDKLANNQNEHEFCKDAVETMKSGIVIAIQKHYQLGHDALAETKAEEALLKKINERRAELQNQNQPNPNVHSKKFSL